MYLVLECGFQDQRQAEALQDYIRNMPRSRDAMEFLQVRSSVLVSHFARS